MIYHGQTLNKDPADTGSYTGTDFLVAFVKIVYGTLTNTLSMKSDGYHSLFDGISNIVGIIAIFVAAKPPDKSHPYGHQKFETLASIIIAILIIFVVSK